MAQRYEKWNTSRWRGARTKKSGARPARLYSTIRQMTVASTPAVTQAQFFFYPRFRIFFGTVYRTQQSYKLSTMCNVHDSGQEDTVHSGKNDTVHSGQEDTMHSG